MSGPARRLTSCPLGGYGTAARVGQVSRRYQASDGAVEKLVVDGGEGYAAAPQRPFGVRPGVVREDVPEVHLRGREPGFPVAVDEQWQERRHRVGRVAGGIPQQVAHPDPERYLADAEPVCT